MCLKPNIVKGDLWTLHTTPMGPPDLKFQAKPSKARQYLGDPLSLAQDAVQGLGRPTFLQLSGILGIDIWGGGKMTRIGVSMQRLHGDLWGILGT